MAAQVTAMSGMNASLYVGDLAPDVTEAIIFDTFNAVGPVASVRVCRDAATQRSLGYAYVNFHRVEDADRALETMNFKNIHGRPCRIMWSHRDPSLRKSGAGNVFVNHLKDDIDNKTLYDTFSVVGNILSCKVATNKKGESLGYGFVHYESQEAADKAIAGIDGKIVSGKVVSVSAFKSKKERSGGGGKHNWTNIFVKNLPEELDEEGFKNMFLKFGEITSLKFGDVTETKSGKRTTRYGFVNFAKNESAVKAIEEMNDKEEGERKLFVARHQKREVRERELRNKHEHEKMERQKAYRGVNLYVKNLSDDVDDAKLAQTFEGYGTITSAKVMVDRTTGKSRGFGFVCFGSQEEATRAVTEMNGRMVDKKPLYVALAQRKEERRAQLEQQYATRNKFPQGSQMYPQGQPIFYQQGVQRAPMMYPPQGMIPAGRWVGQQGGRAGPQMMPAQMAGRAPMNFQLMPAMAGGRQGQQGQQQGGGRRNRGGQRGQGQKGPQGPGPQGQMGGPGQQQLHYRPNVRNQQQMQQQSTMGGPGPAQQRPMGGQPTPGGPGMGQPVQNMASQPLTSSLLAKAPEERQRQMIGERLFPLVQARQPEKAGKITGMLLEMDNTELLHLLESEKALEDNINEALQVLDRDDEEESDEEEDDEEDEEEEA